MPADLARRLVAHPRWSWCEGMRNVLGWRRMDEPAGDWLDDLGAWQSGDPRDGTGLVSPPDLTDAATQGCLVRVYLGALDRLPASHPWTVAQRDEFHRRLGAALCDESGITLAVALLDAWAVLDARGGGE